MIDQLEGQMSFSDLDTWYGKMSREPSAVTVAKTSRRSSKKQSASSSQTFPICLKLRKLGGVGYQTKEDGQSLDASTMKWESGALLGEYMMPSFGECPREENVSRLSQILEDSAPQRYYLSAKACAGILNRAERRGKELPEILKMALENQMNDNRDDLP